MTTTDNWQIDDRTLRLTIADDYIKYLEQVLQSGNNFCCDVNLRLAIQLVCQTPADPEQIKRLRCALGDRLLNTIERDHRPKAAAAIESFKRFYQEWVNSGAAEEAGCPIEQVSIEEAIDIDEFMELVEED